MWIAIKNKIKILSPCDHVLDPTRWPESMDGEDCKMMHELVDDEEGLMDAYQEVPQVSTGFSPFELLYGEGERSPRCAEDWSRRKSGVRSHTKF